MINSKIRKSSVTIDGETVDRAVDFLSVIEATFELSMSLPTKVVIQWEKPRMTSRKKKLLEELDSFFSRIQFNSYELIQPEKLLYYVLFNLASASEVARVFDGSINEKHVFKILQEGCRMGFFEEPNVLRNWCLFNDYWVNRSLRVLNEPSLNSKMIGIEGFPTIDLVFKHAQNQAVYWFIVGVIDLLNGKYR